MKAVTQKEISEELILRSPKELRELCLRLARFKKENKELLTYLLFESSDEPTYIESVKRDIDEQFEKINRKSYYLIRKSLGKILRSTRKFIRYSQKKQTELDLLIYFCVSLRQISPSIRRNAGLQKLYKRQLDIIIKKLPLLHEDLQYDYASEIKTLGDFIKT